MVMKTKINDDDDMFLPGYSIKVPAIQARLGADQTRRPGDQETRAEQGKERCYALCAMLQHWTVEEESVKPAM